MAPGIFEQPVPLGKGGPVDPEIGNMLAENDFQYGMEHITHPKQETSDASAEEEEGRVENERKLPPHDTH